MSLYLGCGSMGKTVALRIPLIYLTDGRDKKKAYFCLDVNGFFKEFFLIIYYTALLFYLSLDGRLEALSKESNQIGLFWSPISNKFKQNKLEVLEIGSSVTRFFYLVLRVALDFTPNVIYKRLGVTKIFLKKDLELRPGYWGYFFVSVAVFVLSPSEADRITKEKSCK